MEMSEADKTSFIVLDSQDSQPVGPEYDWPALNPAKSSEEKAKKDKSIFKNLVDTDLSAEEEIPKEILASDTDLDVPGKQMPYARRVRYPSDDEEETLPDLNFGDVQDGSLGFQCQDRATDSSKTLENPPEGPSKRHSLLSAFPSSQQDIFDDEKAIVCTPSEKIGNLQLSNQPIIVPETVDEDDDELIPPSPSSQYDVPIIIPNSPTLKEDLDNVEEVSVYQPDHDTLASPRTDRQSSDISTSSSSDGQNITVIPMLTPRETIVPSYQPEDASTMRSSLAKDSLHLHYSGTPSEQVEEPSVEITGVESKSDQNEVVVISTEEKEESPSQNLFLRLTPTQKSGNQHQSQKSSPLVEAQASDQPEESAATESVGFRLSLPKDGNLIHPRSIVSPPPLLPLRRDKSQSQCSVRENEEETVHSQQQKAVQFSQEKSLASTSRQSLAPALSSTEASVPSQSEAFFILERPESVGFTDVESDTPVSVFKLKREGKLTSPLKKNFALDESDDDVPRIKLGGDKRGIDEETLSGKASQPFKPEKKRCRKLSSDSEEKMDTTCISPTEQMDVEERPELLDIMMEETECYPVGSPMQVQDNKHLDDMESSSAYIQTTQVDYNVSTPVASTSKQHQIPNADIVNSGRPSLPRLASSQSPANVAATNSVPQNGNEDISPVAASENFSELSCAVLNQRENLRIDPGATALPEIPVSVVSQRKPFQKLTGNVIENSQIQSVPQAPVLSSITHVTSSKDMTSCAPQTQMISTKGSNQDVPLVETPKRQTTVLASAHACLLPSSDPGTYGKTPGKHFGISTTSSAPNNVTSTDNDPYTFHGSQSQTPEKVLVSARQRYARSVPQTKPIKKKVLRTRTKRQLSSSVPEPKSCNQNIEWQSNPESDSPIKKSVSYTRSSSASIHGVSDSLNVNALVRTPTLEDVRKETQPIPSTSRGFVSAVAMDNRSATGLLPNTSPINSGGQHVSFAQSPDTSHQETMVTSTITKLLLIERREITQKFYSKDGKLLFTTTKTEEDPPSLFKEIRHETKEAVTVSEMSPTSSSSASARTSDYFADASTSRSSGSVGSKLSVNMASLEVFQTSQKDAAHNFTPPDQETSIIGVSTINKSGSDIERSRLSLEPGKSSDCLFSSSSHDGGVKAVFVQSSVVGKDACDKQLIKIPSSGDSSEKIPCAQSTFRETATEEESDVIPIQLPTDKESDAVDSNKKSTGKRTDKSSSDNCSPEIPKQLQESLIVHEEELPIKESRINDLIQVELTKGVAIFAKWKDGFFYPGVIKNVSDNRFTVHFDDGNKLVVEEEDIIPVKFIPTGYSVMVQRDPSSIDFEGGVVMDHRGQGCNISYTVQTEDNTMNKYKRSLMCLTDTQGLSLMIDLGKSGQLLSPKLQMPSTPKISDVTLDNLLSGKRRRKQGKETPCSSLAVESTSNEDDLKSSTRGRKRRRILEPKATSTPTPIAKRVAKHSRVEASPIQGMEPDIPKIRHSPRKAKAGLFEVEASASTSSATFFRGFVFILTHADKSPEQKQLVKEFLKDTTGSTTDESTSEEDATVPFNKEELIQLIESAGGLILDKFSQSQTEAARMSFLISDSFQRTIKYIQSLAASIPCVSHVWIYDCIQQGKFLDYKSYLLQAGLSLEKRKIIEWNNRQGNLQNVVAMVVSEKKKYVEEWKIVLNAAGCKVIDNFPSPKLSDVNLKVIITDDTCPQSIVRKANKKNIPLLSSEWVIQCLINGMQMEYDGHFKYAYDYVDI